MKKALFFMIIPIYLVSCHKNKNNGTQVISCDSYMIGVAYVSPGTVGTNVTIVTTDANTGQIIKNYKNAIQVGDNYFEAMGAYDHLHTSYYLCGSINASNATELYKFNASTGITYLLGYPHLLDTAGGSLKNLICNSTTNKLYFFCNDYYTSENAIYEITPNDTSFTQKLVFDTGNNSNSIQIYSPIINENTGYIYFFINSASGTDCLMKINPDNGASSFVAYSIISPFGLIYNNNDGLFYGLNVYHFAYAPYNSASASFISIDPVTGAVTSIIDTISGYDGSTNTAFDFCNNTFVLLGERTTTWYELATGKVVKQLNYQSPIGNVGIY